MRTANRNSVQYAPGLCPPDPKEIPQFLNIELGKLQAVIQLLALGHIDKQNAAPANPRDGDIRYADGTAWNPGSGVGIYYYKASGPAWVLLG